MTLAIVAAVKSSRNVMENNDIPVRRHSVGIDCLSLNEGDSLVSSAEDEATSALMFLQILRDLPSEKEKFIALGLVYGLSKADIAFTLKLDPSRITRWTQSMRIKLAGYRAVSN